MKFRFYHENVYTTNDCGYLLAKAMKLFSGNLFGALV